MNFWSRACRVIADTINARMRDIGYYPLEDLVGLEQQFISVADAKRQDTELLQLAVSEYEAQITDIKDVRAAVAGLEPDAPPAMLTHMIKRQDELMESLIVRVERRVRLRQKALAQPRDAAGKFLSGARP